jgi:alpha-ketoglutaric semialdehyde dehydrogenase
MAEVDRAARAARAAFEHGGWSDGRLRARGLRAIARALERAREGLLRTASRETGLWVSELTPEFDRMIGTLRLFAELAADDTWRRAAVSPRAGARSIGPDHELRCGLIPLGPVAVFGASNFPLAYGVCGGDTASALAAGCPVIVKEHPAHPRTGRRLYRLAREALRRVGSRAGLPAPVVAGLLRYVPNTDPARTEVGAALVSHPDVAAVGFTGSGRGGLALEGLARARAVPIPVFAEMGSVNPVRITPRALRARGAAIGAALASSVLARAGQQCTKPGLVLLPPGAGGAALREAMGERFRAAPSRRLLAPWIAAAFRARVAAILSLPGVGVVAEGRPAPARRSDARWARPVLLEVHARHLRPVLLEEVFGPACLLVHLDGWDDPRLPRPPSLTWTIHAEPGDLLDRGRTLGTLPLRREIERAGRAAGRVIFDGVPTGVRVCEAMVHGGPFPATNTPWTTAVGPRAIERWARPVSWQNAPAALVRGGRA